MRYLLLLTIFIGPAVYAVDSPCVTKQKNAACYELAQSMGVPVQSAKVVSFKHGPWTEALGNNTGSDTITVQIPNRSNRGTTTKTYEVAARQKGRSNDCTVTNVRGTQSLFVCRVGLKARPYDSFNVTLHGTSHASITYLRHAFFGSEEMPFERKVPGCSRAKQSFEPRQALLRLHCDRGGDSGIVSLRLSRDNKSAYGTIAFPEGNIGYRKGTKLSVSCVKK